MKRRRTVTIATRVFEPEGSAAAYRLAALTRAFEAKGYIATVMTTQPSIRQKSTKRVRRWPVLRDRSGAVRGYLQYASFDIPLFFRLLFGPAADVVVVEPPPTTGTVSRVALFFRRTPYIYFSADVTSSAVAGIGVNPAVVVGVRWLERFSLVGARGVLAISPEVRREVIELGADPGKVFMIGTGVDTALFSGAGTRVETADPYFIYAGTMSEFQGARVFVEAFAEVLAERPGVRLAMFGGGVELPVIQALADKLTPGSVDFPGTIGSHELTPWLRGATAGLVSIRPDAGYDFAFPTKTLASISCGTPVIYAGAGPAAALVKDNDLGWAVDWDPTEIARAMRAALASERNDTDRRRLSDWANDNYSLEAVADRAVTAIESVC